MAAFQTLGVPDSKDVPDVLAPLPVVQGGLARIGFGAHHACRIGGDAGGFGYAPCYPIALVVAPLPFLFPGQGNGHDEVLSRRKSLWLSVPRPSYAPWFSLLRDGYGISVRTKCGCKESVGRNGKKKFPFRWEPVPRICGRCRFLQTRWSGHVGGRPGIVHKLPLRPATCACGNKGNTGGRKSPKGLGGTARDYVKSSSSTCRQRVMAFISNPRLRPKRMSFPLRS